MSSVPPNITLFQNAFTRTVKPAGFSSWYTSSLLLHWVWNDSFPYKPPSCAWMIQTAIRAVCLSHTVQRQFPPHLKMPFSPPSLALCEHALLILAATGCHCCAHTPTHDTSCALSIDNGVPVWMDRQMCALEGHLPGQGPNPSQHWVHHRDGEVLPLPGAEGILLHHLGHGQPLEQPVGQPENQRAHQYWRAWVTLEHRKQGLHPLLPTPLSLGACS